MQAFLILKRIEMHFTRFYMLSIVTTFIRRQSNDESCFLRTLLVEDLFRSKNIFEWQCCVCQSLQLKKGTQIGLKFLFNTLDIIAYKNDENILQHPMGKCLKELLSSTTSSKTGWATSGGADPSIGRVSENFSSTTLKRTSLPGSMNSSAVPSSV
uniref:Uncharacterized protein n=1 Tax=Romanomermis culicivorax TaxID=13658 RepID=A0A915KEG2_ROMCU